MHVAAHGREGRVVPLASHLAVVRLGNRLTSSPSRPPLVSGPTPSRRSTRWGTS